jgi:hypothetical protein
MVANGCGDWSDMRQRRSHLPCRRLKLNVFNDSVCNTSHVMMFVAPLLPSWIYICVSASLGSLTAAHPAHAHLTSCGRRQHRVKMGLFNRTAARADEISPPSSSPERLPEKDAETIHTESASATGDHHGKFLVSKTGDGDVAMALFHSPTEVHEPIDPREEAKVVRKIDFMILPYLAVCYAFFYIDKTTLSYAAIFGIKDDLNLVGTEYNWLSSIC